MYRTARTPLNGLSLKDTNALKGIALLLLLCHHLFYKQNGDYNDIVVIGQHGLVQEFAIASKVCVAIFVFLSGYGLTKKYENTTLLTRDFYVNRFVKLFMNFWLIWILFVPIGFLLGRTFGEVYQHHIWLKAIIDFFGMAYGFGYYGINPTWWFMSCIIILYMLFPFLFKFRNCRIGLLLLSFIVIWIPFSIFNPIKYYLTAFVAGILCSQDPLFNKIISLRNVYAKIGVTLLSIACFLIRNFIPYSLLFDSLLAICIVITYKLIVKSEGIIQCLMFLGKHSMNIFLFHTFIYYYYFRSLIYYSSNPLVIFITLLSICLIISIVIEYLKEMLHFENAYNKIIKCLK